MPADGGVAGVRNVLIRLLGVAKDYDTGGGIVRALRDVDLSIDHGEFVAIVGTSGSGKSTLMNILGCLDRPTRGTYTLADIEVGSRSNDARAIVRNRLVGFIFQGFNLLPRTTALENVELPLQYRGVSAKARKARAEQSLAAVGLQDRLDHTPNMLSGGQQQRVAIARALVTDPPLLLADEPTGNLDTRTSLEVLALLQRLNREMGITVVLVTHEHDIAACASRVITFRDGFMVSDVRQDKPKDAARDLAELPPPKAYEAPKDDDAIVGTKKRTKIPFVVYMAMFGGGLLGAPAAFVWNQIAGQPIPSLGGVLSILGEASLATWIARRRFKRRMSADERARVAIYYSLFELLIIAPVVAFLVLAKIPPYVIAFATAHSGLAALAFIVALGVLSLVRFLFLSLANSRPLR